MKLNNSFGPLALIFEKQLVDVMKFLALLLIFLFGFTMLTMALNEKLVFKNRKAMNSFTPTIEDDLETDLKTGNMTSTMDCELV